MQSVSRQYFCSIVLQHQGERMHKCRSRQILGMRRIFFRISPNFPEKILGHFWPPKKSSCDCANIGRHIFLNQTTLGTISAQIFRDFTKVFIAFAQNYTDFSRIFTKSKLLGVLLHPASYTTEWMSILSELMSLAEPYCSMWKAITTFVS